MQSRRSPRSDLKEVGGRDRRCGDGEKNLKPRYRDYRFPPEQAKARESVPVRTPLTKLTMLLRG